MLRLFFDYTTWHYTHALVAIFSLAKEFVRFFLNLFSVKLSLFNLFRPVFSIPVDDIESTYEGDMIATFLGGVLMRILGAIFRMILVVLGLLTSILSIVSFVVVAILWVCMPVVLVLTLYYLVSFSLTTL